MLLYIMEKEEFINEIDKSVKVQVSKPKNKKKGQRTTPQYFIHIPKEVVLELGIKQGDIVRFYIPLKEKSKYFIKFEKDMK